MFFTYRAACDRKKQFISDVGMRIADFKKHRGKEGQSNKGTEAQSSKVTEGVIFYFLKPLRLCGEKQV